MAAIRAQDIMTADVKTVAEESSLRDIAELLAENSISGAPVVDRAGKLVGIVTEADLLDREKITSAERKRVSGMPRTALFGFWVVPEGLLKDAYKDSLTLKARDVMTRDVITADVDATVDQLADLMVKKRVNRIPILREGELVGIVSRHDVLDGMRLR